MPELETTNLKTEYAAKVTADLEHNRGEQERICGELEALREQLATLERDRELLQSMSTALGDPAAGLPAPRRTAEKTTDEAKATVKQAAAKKAPAKKTPAKKDEPKGAAKKAAAPAVKQADKEPALTELIVHHLSVQSEPRTAAEIAKALVGAHPDRSVSDNMVRTSTERLVARSRVERAKQGSTVYYTAVKETSVKAPQAGQEAVGVTA